MKLVAATIVVAFALMCGLVGYSLKDDTAPASTYQGGTAREWQRQAEGWQVITERYERVADRYRTLNERLLKKLEEGV